MKAIPKKFLDGGAGLTRGNKYMTSDGAMIDLWEVLTSLAGASYVNVAAAQALGPDDQAGIITVAGRPFVWLPGSLANDATSQLAITPTGVASGTAGRWELAAGATSLKLPFTFATVDGTVLFTVPTGWTLAIPRFYYDVSVGFVNAAGRIGASSSNAQYNTAGDLIGGAGGDAAAALTIGCCGGTLGTKYGTNGMVELVAGDTIKLNVIVGGYTAGAANLVALATRV